MPCPRRCDLAALNILVPIIADVPRRGTSPGKPPYEEVCGLKEDTQQEEEEHNLVLCGGEVDGLLSSVISILLPLVEQLVVQFWIWLQSETHVRL